MKEKKTLKFISRKTPRKIFNFLKKNHKYICLLSKLVKRLHSHRIHIMYTYAQSLLTVS